MLGPQDAGHAGVATGRGGFSLRSSNLVKSPPHFSFVQFRALAPRVISHLGIKGKERLLFLSVLCLSGLSKRPPHFVVQLQRLEPRVISHPRIKGKERLLFLGVLCLSALGKPPPHFSFVQIFFL
jgi:hypothetical protein